jgi:hypothetical protein
VNDFAEVTQAIQQRPDLLEASSAAAEVLASAVSGERPAQCRYTSWSELDEAYKQVQLENLKSDVLQRLFQFALLAAMRVLAEGGQGS